MRKFINIFAALVFASSGAFAEEIPNDLAPAEEFSDFDAMRNFLGMNHDAQGSFGTSVNVFDRNPPPRRPGPGRPGPAPGRPRPPHRPPPYVVPRPPVRPRPPAPPPPYYPPRAFYTCFAESVYSRELFRANGDDAYYTQDWAMYDCNMRWTQCRPLGCRRN